MQEYGFDTGNMKAFADKECTLEIKMESIPKDVLQEILGGIPIIRCRECVDYDSEAHWCIHNGIDIDEDGYCCWGERREVE